MIGSMYGVWGHPLGCCCQGCAGAMGMAGPYGVTIDPAVISAAIASGTAITTSAITAASDVAIAKKAAKSATTYQPAAYVPPPAPPAPQSAIPGWAVGLGVAVLVALGAYALTRPASVKAAA